MKKSKPQKILVAYSASSTYTSTVLHYLQALKKFTDFEVDYLHVTHDAIIDVDLNDYDVVFHNYCARLCFPDYISKSYEQALLLFRGLKVVAVQDDYDSTALLQQAIRRLGFHVLITCIQSEYWPIVYPESELPGVKIVQGLTGYIPDELLDQNTFAKPMEKREIFVGYRGRDIGARYGQLGYDKYRIGEVMIKFCEERGIPFDIAMDEESRLYGDAWFQFIGNTRAMLGSESGSNVFDFDGEVREFIADYERSVKRKASYLDVRQYLEPREEYFSVGQISPRVFECALLYTPMILFRGSYSDAISADAHYIALEKDFSNIDDVLRAVENVDYLKSLADQTYKHLVASGRYSYRAFGSFLAGVINEEFARRIDPNWLGFCRMHRSPWRKFQEKHLRLSTQPERTEMLKEVATSIPKSSHEFNEKLKKLSLKSDDFLYLNTANYKLSVRRNSFMLKPVFAIWNQFDSKTKITLKKQLGRILGRSS
jgi:hypothetical protein